MIKSEHIEIEVDDDVTIAEYWAVAKDAAEDVDGVVERGEIVAEFVHSLARINQHQNVDGTTVDGLLGRFAKLVGATKGTVKDDYRTAKEKVVEEVAEAEAEAVESGEVQPDTIYEMVQFTCEKITVYSPTDASVDPRYVWDFGEFEVETEAEHRSQEAFIEAIFGASGSETPLSTAEDMNQNWSEYIRSWIATEGVRSATRVDKTIVGARTQAVEDLLDRLSRLDPAGEISEAISQRRPYFRSESVVEVSASVIKRALRTHDSVTQRDLQIELDARGARAGNVRQTTVNGSSVRMWQLDRGWLENNIELSLAEGDENE